MTDSQEQAMPARKSKSLIRSTSLVSSMTMLSRVLGFVRDVVIATMFGAVAGVDAFFVAFKIPNFMRRLFAEGAFSQAFVPVLSEYQKNRSQDEVKQFISHIAGNLGVILFAFTIVAVIATPILVMIFAPGFGYGSTRFVIASYMLKITFPYLMLISLTAMAGAVLNTYGSFGIPAFTPVLLNVSLIGSAVFLSPYFKEPIEACAWGVLVAGVVQLLFQLPFLKRIRLLPKPKISWQDTGVTRVLKLMVPALFGVSVAQINLMLDTIFASFLPVGSVSWLYYSDRLMNFPLGVFGVAIATVILPTLSRKHAEQSLQEFSMTLDWALRSILIIAIPSALGLLLLAGPLLTTLFNYGRFTSHDVMMAHLSLMAFAIGVPAFMLIKTLASGFYARQNIKTPVKIAAAAMITNMVLNLLLIKPLAHAGLALATSLAAFLNAGLLFYFLSRRKIYRAQPGWAAYILQLIFSNTMLAAWLLWQRGNMPQWLSWGWHQRGGHLLYLVVVAVIIYLASLGVSGVRIKHFRGDAF